MDHTCTPRHWPLPPPPAITPLQLLSRSPPPQPLPPPRSVHTPPAGPVPCISAFASLAVPQHCRRTAASPTAPPLDAGLLFPSVVSLLLLLFFLLLSANPPHHRKHDEALLRPRDRAPRCARPRGGTQQADFAHQAQRRIHGPPRHGVSRGRV